MIVDASALIAIAKLEPEADPFIEQIARAAEPRMSAANFLETAIVVDNAADPLLSGRFDEWFEASRIAIMPVTEQQARLARTAYRTFGKGSGHPAQLNFGDCFAYALAKDLGEPLLFKGQDFTRTDIRPIISTSEG